jgi:type IV pilus assembly protein PilN
MPRINLLPWREQQRTDRKKAFGVGIAAAAIGALALTGLAFLFFNGLIDSQQVRNDKLRTEIKELDKQIEQINNFEVQKQQRIARMQIIEKLQQSRPEIVHVFDTFTRTTPEGAYLTSIKQTDQKFTIVGIGQSPARASDLYRSLDQSQWVKEPEIMGVDEKPNGYEFTIDAKQRVSAIEEAEAAKAKDKQKKP